MEPFSGKSSTTRTLSINAVWTRGAQNHAAGRPNAVKLAAKCVQQLHRAHSLVGGHGSGLSTCCKMRHDDRDDGEEYERTDISRIGDREGIDRRKKEEIVTQRGN